MKKAMRLAVSLTACALLVSAAEKKVQLKDLPAVVQKAVQEQTRGAEIKGISKETEKGVVQYEVETILNGKHRDLTIDTKGALVELEEEVPIAALPASVKAAIDKKVGAGKLRIVETVTKGSTVIYEAHYSGKDGKKHELLLKPDGTETKE